MCDDLLILFFFFFQAEDGIRDKLVTGVQTCALPILVVPSSISLAMRGEFFITSTTAVILFSLVLTSLREMIPRRTSESWERIRSEERRVRKECRSRWSPYH